MLCTYKGAQFLSEQLRSILMQSRLPDQIVLSDDCSPDDGTTLAILEEFAIEAETAGIAVILRQQAINLGYVKNFESALQLAEGELIFLCDQDDIWYPNKIEAMADIFAQRPELDLLHSDADLIDANGASLGYSLFDAIEYSTRERKDVHRGEATQVLLRRNVVTGAATAIRRRVLKNALPLVDGWIHDEWIALCAAMHGQVDSLELKLIDYRQHGSNAIGVHKRTIQERLRPPIPRRKFLQMMDARYAALQESVVYNRTVPNAVKLDIDQRKLHAYSRAHLPNGVFQRVLWVLKEASTGRYRKYSFGLRSIVSDLLVLD